jgi:hypothetical protein
MSLTIAQIIEILQKYPQDSKLVVWAQDGVWYYVSEIDLDGHNRPAINPQNEI